MMMMMMMMMMIDKMTFIFIWLIPDYLFQANQSLLLQAVSYIIFLIKMFGHVTGIYPNNLSCF